MAADIEPGAILTDEQIEAAYGRGGRPVAWVRYAVGQMPQFVPVITGSTTFRCSAIEALEYQPLYAGEEFYAMRDALAKAGVAQRSES